LNKFKLKTVKKDMKTTKVVISLLALSMGAASADLRGNGVQKQGRSEQSSPSVKEGVKGFAKNIWGEIRYQRHAIKDTLFGTNERYDYEQYRRPELQTPRRSEYRPVERGRQSQGEYDYDAGPYRQDERQVQADQRQGDFAYPEPLWKNYERDLDKRREAEAAAGYEDRRGQSLPDPRVQPQYEPQMDPRRQREEDQQYRNLPNDRGGQYDYEEAEVKPLGPQNKVQSQSPDQKHPTTKEVVVTPPKEKTVVKTPEKKAEAPKPKSSDFPPATKTKKEGFVLSPYPPYDMLDVTGLGSGSLAKDPKTGQIFRVP
jgi:hypothetical protein